MLSCLTADIGPSMTWGVVLAVNRHAGTNSTSMGSILTRMLNAIQAGSRFSQRRLHNETIGRLQSLHFNRPERIVCMLKF